MDALVSAAAGMQQARVVSQVQYAVARRLLEQQQLQGTLAVRLIEAAARTTVQAGDELVAAATGLGGRLDVYA
ncbi:MAG: hypothetical protein NZ561_07930 [Phycisphaerae bacterium]|nr:hypothetical protein [Phycisphaerae bacterium]